MDEGLSDHEKDPRDSSQRRAVTYLMMQKRDSRNPKGNRTLRGNQGRQLPRVRDRFCPRRRRAGQNKKAQAKGQKQETLERDQGRRLLPALREVPTVGMLATQRT